MLEHAHHELNEGHDQLKEEHLLIKDIQGQYSSRLQNLESSLHHPQQSLLFFYWIAKGY